jgi:alkylhydroperoxidase family enzyme
MAKKTPIDLVYETDNPEVLETFEKVKGKTGIGKIHRLVANSPTVFGRFIGLAHGLRHNTILDPLERELAICCGLERHNGHYELVPHRQFAIMLGATEAQVANVCNSGDPSAPFTDRQRAILRFAEKVAADPDRIGELEEDGVEAYLNNQERVELALNVAIYIGLAHLTGALDIPKEDAAMMAAMAKSPALAPGG